MSSVISEPKLDHSEICAAHADIVKSHSNAVKNLGEVNITLATTNTSLRWLVKIGAAIIPITLYLISQVVDMKQQVALANAKTEHVEARITALKEDVHRYHASDTTMSQNRK